MRPRSRAHWRPSLLARVQNSRFERVIRAGAGHSPRPATSPNRPMIGTERKEITVQAQAGPNLKVGRHELCVQFSHEIAHNEPRNLKFSRCAGLGGGVTPPPPLPIRDPFVNLRPRRPGGPVATRWRRRSPGPPAPAQAGTRGATKGYAPHTALFFWRKWFIFQDVVFFSGATHFGSVTLQANSLSFSP